MLRTCMYWKKKKKRKKKNKKQKQKRFGCNRVRTANACMGSNVTTTAPEHYVLKKETSFYIITYSS